MNTATIPQSAAAWLTDDERWAAVVARAREADGQFYYSVRSTGVYCRPSCPSRTPRRANVAFHATPHDAEAAGIGFGSGASATGVMPTVTLALLVPPSPSLIV